MATAKKSLHQIGRPDATLWILAALLLLSTTGFGLYYYYDRYVHQDERILDRQAQRIEEMIQKNPQNPDLRVAVATYYLDNSLLAPAIQQAEEALKINPKHSGAMLLLGRAHAKKGEVERAIAQYELVAALSKDNPMAGIDQRLEGVYYELGRLYGQQGNDAKAIDALKNALAIDQTDADAHFVLGAAYQRQGDHTKAVREFQEALRFDPFFGDPYKGLATSWTALGKADEAAYAQGMVLFSQGNYAEAATQLEGVAARSPGLAQVDLGLGLAYEKLGKRDSGIAALQRFLATSPDDIAAGQALARLSREFRP